MIRREARRIVTSPLAWFCVVIYAAVLLMGIAETLKIKEAISDQGWLDLLCVSEEYGITTLVKNLVFPMSVASVYFDEKKGKCDWVKMMRTSRLRYCVTKAIAVFVGSIFLYMMSVLNSLQVAAWSSMLGLCVAAFSENRYVVAAVPFFINRIFLYLGDMIDWLSIVSPYSYQPIQFWYTGTQVDLFWLAFKNLAVMFLFTCIFIEEMEVITWLIEEQRKRQNKSLATHV